MRKRILGIVTAAVTAAAASSTPLTVCDFENYPIGTTWTLWHNGNGEIASTATVEADPANAGNKVLHIVLKEWGCHPEFELPTELRGKALTDRYPMVKFDLYRSTSDADDWKQFAVFVGTQEVYRDEGYPYRGDKGVCQV